MNSEGNRSFGFMLTLQRSNRDAIILISAHFRNEWTNEWMSPDVDAQLTSFIGEPVMKSYKWTYCLNLTVALQLMFSGEIIYLFPEYVFMN